MTANDPGQNEQSECRSCLMKPEGILSESGLLEKSNVGLFHTVSGLQAHATFYLNFGKSFKQHRPDGFAVSHAQVEPFVCVTTNSLAFLSVAATALLTPKQ